MRSISLQTFALILIVGCSGKETPGNDQFPGTGGSLTGGATGSGSALGTGGTVNGSGSASATGGFTASGGNVGTGGTSTGGESASGGNGTGGITSTCSEPDGEVCANQTGTHCGYTYEYWKDQGTGCLTNTNDGFSVEWNNINNLLGRKGVRPGTANNVVTYDADYKPVGNSYLCVYGWTKSPLVEYYIVDSWGNWRPPGAVAKDQVTTDDGTYDIYETERVNQPSIEGTKTFKQYWSVRTTKRESGTITVKNHFDAWAKNDMPMGTMYEVSMCVEGYQSSGTADVSVSIQ